MFILYDDLARIDLNGSQIGVVDADDNRLRAVVLDDIGGGQMVQVRKEVLRSCVGRRLGFSGSQSPVA